MLSRQSRLLLRRTGLPPLNNTSPASVVVPAGKRGKSSKSESNVINFEAKARVKEHARRIGTSSKVGVEVAR